MSDKDTDLTAEEQAAMDAMRDGKPFETEEATPEAVEQETTEAYAAPDEAEAEAPPAAEEAQEEATEGEKPPKGFVPYDALYAERQERKKLEHRLAELETRAQSKEEPKEPEPVPDPVTQPDEFTAWLKRNQEQGSQSVEDLRRQVQEQQHRQAVAQRVSAAEAEFAKATPDYMDAVNHLMQARQRELSFFTDDADAVRQQVQQEAWALAEAAVQRGRNPAQVAYEIAQARGYRPKKAEPEQPPAAERIKAQAAAQEATQSLSQAGGPANTGRPTAEDLAKMSEAEFAKLDPEVIREVMGGA